MRPWSLEGALPNFLPSLDPAEVARTYDSETVTRLEGLSTTYDPLRVLVAATPFRGE